MKKQLGLKSRLTMPTFDNKSVAAILYETADLMEVRGDDSFRIRSYRNAAQALESLPTPIAELVGDAKKLLEIPGIGKSMASHIQELFREGKLQMHSELLAKYQPAMLDLLKIQGLGPRRWRSSGTPSRFAIRLAWRSWRAKASCANCRAWARSRSRIF